MEYVVYVAPAYARTWLPTGAPLVAHGDGHPHPVVPAPLLIRSTALYDTMAYYITPI